MHAQRRRRPFGNRINAFSVPRDRVDRACCPLRESHQRTWFTMHALLVTARRPVSNRGEICCRWRYYDTSREMPVNRERPSPELFPPVYQSARRLPIPKSPSSDHRARLRFLGAQPPKISRKKSKGLRAGSNPSKRPIDQSADACAVEGPSRGLCSAPKMQRRAL